jgi:hypothetical protein
VPDTPYRAPLPIPPDPYEKAWDDVRRRRRLATIAHVPWLTAFGLTIALQSFGSYVVTGGLFAVGWAAMIHDGLFRCPRCSHYFKRTAARGRLSFDSSRCAWCGIQIGTPKAAVAEAEKRASNVAGAGA